MGGAVAVSAGSFNPLGWKVVLLSAVAGSFGGTSLLAWYPMLPDPSAPERPAALPRSRAAIVLAAVLLAIFVGVLGPGLKL